MKEFWHSIRTGWEDTKMPHYYLDIETTGLDENTDEIITIQYQKIYVLTGKPIGPLVILKSWEYDEEAIVKEIDSIINGDSHLSSSFLQRRLGNIVANKSMSNTLYQDLILTSNQL
jgi:oligoribonuclease (3'-5' exoribonuclease)